MKEHVYTLHDARLHSVSLRRGRNELRLSVRRPDRPSKGDRISLRNYSAHVPDCSGEVIKVMHPTEWDRRANSAQVLVLLDEAIPDA